jgi:transcription-repair coupling factor (superfamily II helicase)
MLPDKFPEFALESWLTKGDSLPPFRTHFVGLEDLGKGMVISALSRKASQPLLVVFNTRAEARNAIDNVCYFGGDTLEQRVHYLPALDFDFYRGLLPNPETLCEKNVGLFHALNDPGGRVFVTTVSSLLQRVVPPQEYLRATRVLQPNDEVDREALVHSFLEAGYQRQPAAYDPGVFAVRGGVVDVFSPLYPQPLRLEFFGDFIEEIRFFDPQSQRSLEKQEKAFVLPVGQSLIPRGEEFVTAAAKVKERLDALGIPKATREEILEQIQGGALSFELSFLFPLLSGGSTSLAEYFPKDTVILWDGEKAVEETAREKDLPTLAKNHELFEKQPLPVAKSEELFLTLQDLKETIARPETYFFETFLSKEGPKHWPIKSEAVSLKEERDASRQRSSNHPLLEAFVVKFKSWMDEGYRIQMVCHTQTHADRIQALFDPYSISCRLHQEGDEAFSRMLRTDFSVVNLWQGYVTHSQKFPLLRLILLGEEEIFGAKKRTAKASAWSSKTHPSRVLSSFKDLQVNDFVVHKDNGIGRYLGLKSMNFLGCPNDYVLLEYRDGDKLYVPVYRLNVLQKYAGAEGGTPLLDKLGGDRWTKAKQKAEKAVAELAAEFLKIQAKRKLIPARPFAEPNEEFRKFEMEFPFDETPDQFKAIEDVMGDLSRPTPMDRLICGDVGYGKTEVALRATYRCVLDNRQAAILVPTTVLAFQHFESFKARLQNTGARVEMVSRLRTPTETKKTLAALKEGKIDVLIGTHRLLSADVDFRDLGLVVVDEEHRFGVVHKERLKKLSESVHMLSMTATPIPRTLNMAMTGIKDISIITTPPPDRLSVRTFVCRRSEEVIAEAIVQELTREGQVFFVHNRIESIFGVAEELKRLIPKIKLEVVHGQMDGETLEKKMLSFYDGTFHVLLTTAIIESGLDIARANTIIIDDADHFGLAQLYQLRGRVGRAARRAYCYLLVPGENLITADAKQRLQVIQRYTDLGAGFSVASHDLEIRGAGDLLGKEQSGHLTAIGVDLYFELLEESIRALQGEDRRLEIEPEINLKVPAFFPEAYLPDIAERISIYRRLSSVESEEGISEVETEIRDRFGTLPVEVTNLIGIMQLKLYLKKLHVVRMSCGPKRTSLQFAPTTPASPDRLVKLIQSNPKLYAITPDQKFVFHCEDTDWKKLLREIQKLSDQLGVS